MSDDEAALGELQKDKNMLSVFTLLTMPAVS
jgi:hypothetical protein